MPIITKNKSTKLYSLSDTDLFLDQGSRDYTLRIKDLPLENKPREKMTKQGPEALSLTELLAVILNTGNRNEDVLEMSNRIIREYGERSIISEKNVTKLSEELSIPTGKACQIIACGEIGRRLYERDTSGLTVIRNAKDVYEYLRDMYNLPKEHLRGLYLNSHNRIIHDEVISIGTINSNIIHAREVFRPAIQYNAAAIVLAHNHPSDVATPSKQDIEITHQLIESGKMIGIHILDHVIITKSTHVSINAHY
jgi:DNA repair protein RadC